MSWNTVKFICLFFITKKRNLWVVILKIQLRTSLVLYMSHPNGAVVRAEHCKSSGCEFEYGSNLCLWDVFPRMMGECCLTILAGLCNKDLLSISDGVHNNLVLFVVIEWRALQAY